MSDDFAQIFAMSKYASSKDRERAIVEYVEHLQTRLAEVEAENAELKGKQFEILGWAHAFFCTELDDGKDPRNLDISVMVEKAIKQLGLKDKNVFSDCGCRFESDTGNSVILCEQCSKLPCHNKQQGE